MGTLASRVFTGIIDYFGRVVSAEASPAGRRLVILPAEGLCGGGGLGEGESIAVNGCCLTVVADVEAGEAAGFDVIPETLGKTTIGRLKAGDDVHLERSATAATLLGGHVVQGHVEAVGEVLKIVRPEDEGSGGEWRVRVGLPGELLPCVVPKGSVAIEGVSLTVAAVDSGDEASGWFEVALIPTTLSKTVLGRLAPGDGVNVETDILARTVVNALRHYGERFGLGVGSSGGSGR